jgi:hypothetical protein
MNSDISPDPRLEHIPNLQLFERRSCSGEPDGSPKADRFASHSVTDVRISFGDRCSPTIDRQDTDNGSCFASDGIIVSREECHGNEDNHEVETKAGKTASADG